jgi:YebC/PmpR family DNA-binding regulatory protein
MSGHSKWATTKHQKGAKDAKRSKLFAKLIRQIEVAAREGGGDVGANATLRTMVQKARDASVPIDTIEKAMKRGSGALEGVRYEPINYEGYAPCGVALYVETLSDNRNRTGAEVRNIFSKNGGSIAEPGAVAWQFARKGSILLPKAAGSEDDLMLQVLEAGAEDLVDLGGSWQVITEATDLHAVRTAIEEAKIAVESSDLIMQASQTVPLADEGDVRKVLHLIEALDDHDDVQNIWANFDASDEVLELATG